MNHEEKPTWIARKTVGPSKTGRDGKTVCIITVQLVHGVHKIKNGRPEIEGESFHELTGPTAEASIRDFAAKLNAVNYPAKKLPPEFLRRSRKRDDPNQMSLAMMIKPDFKAL